MGLLHIGDKQDMLFSKYYRGNTTEISLCSIKFHTQFGWVLSPVYNTVMICLILVFYCLLPVA